MRNTLYLHYLAATVCRPMHYTYTTLMKEAGPKSFLMFCFIIIFGVLKQHVFFSVVVLLYLISQHCRDQNCKSQNGHSNIF